MRRAALPLALLATLLLVVAGVAVHLLRPGDPVVTRPALLAASPSPSPLPALLALTGQEPAPSAAGVQASVRAAATAAGLGTDAVVRVVDAATGEPLLQVGADRLVVPASTSKILTAAAVLTRVPGDLVLTTRVVGGAAGLTLVGAGDPTLTRADLTDLARSVRAAGLTSVARVAVDTSVWTDDPIGPGWKPNYVTGGDVAPVVALMTDEGRTTPGAGARSSAPDLLAGRQFLAALSAAGVAVPADVVRSDAPAGAPLVASHDSPSVPEMVARMLTNSDNDIAEAMGRLLSRQTGGAATFQGAAAAIRAGVVALGAPAADVAVRDGSGLSTLSRVTPSVVVRMLRLAVSDKPMLRPIVAGLPVAGFDGTLADRFRVAADGSSAAGRVRAKTGTLLGVSALAGYVVDADGRLLVFDATADGLAATGTATLEARAALDRVAAGLAACGCR